MKDKIMKQQKLVSTFKDFIAVLLFLIKLRLLV